MIERGFSRIFRALVITLSAPAACGPVQDTPDGGNDASVGDASDVVTNPFPDGATLDSYVDWCEAGAPRILGNDGCYAYFFVPCGLPPGDFVQDDAGTINRCDQICKGVNAHDCEIMNDAAVATLLDSGLVLDSGSNDAADGSDDAATATSPAIYVVCGCYNGGRRPAGLRAPSSTTACKRPLAAYFSQMAHLEAASVPAFRRMRAELGALGASGVLLRRIERAASDEKRHARIVGRIAKKLGGAAPAASVRRFRKRSVEAAARENVTEGCVRETYGALVATWQAEHARDPMIRRAMASIAADETRHAELSFSAARFLDGKLDERAHARIERARRRAIAKLYDETSRDPDAEMLDRAGLPSATDAKRLLDALAAAVWP